MPSGPGPDAARAFAELSVMIDALDGLRSRTASLAEPFLGTEREDVVTAVHEAERSILMAVRAMQRALKTLER